MKEIGYNTKVTNENHNGILGVHMKKDIRLGAAVAGLCLGLFLIVISVGSLSEEPSLSTENEVTQSGTENSGAENDATEVFGTEDLSTEVIGTESPSTDETEDGANTGTGTDTETDTDSGEYLSFAIADVNSYVNVRKEPNTDSSILGKIYDGAVAQILSTVGEGENMWFQIVSGNVEGYIKAEYFIYGEEAAAVMDQYVAKFVQVNVSELNVRKDKTTNSARIGYVSSGERLRLLEDCGEWIKVQYTDKIVGYVFAQYVTIQEEYIYAKSPADEKAERDFIKELEKRAGVSEDKVKEDTSVTVKPPSASYETNSELRKAIIDYAMQYLGNRYVSGGQSLKSGTDCSGFTMLVLREFGISVGRTPQNQYTSAGRKISYAEAQPGDILCYSDNGGRSCTHVAFYIGNGQILHSSTPKGGVKISPANYAKIYAVRNVID